ncbi:DUF2750 domain-containing protein [Paraglaciecola aestuariivivens]
MNEISPEKFLALSKMLPEDRFEYALEQMISKQYLWGLYGENGWVMLKADDDACLPIWPNKEFALAWVKEDFPNCEPKQIDFEQWMQEWLPGMKNNNTLVLVFPLSEDEEGVMLEAEEMLNCLEEDLAKINSNS